jgi:CTP-dependent riboflavin kinase
VKLRQELEQAMAHTSTLESRLQAALMETEAARASEAMALQEIKYIKEKESTNRDNVQAGQEVTHSHEDYEVLTRKMHEAEELANKRVAAAIAQVGFESEILELHAFCPGLLVFCITAVPLYPLSHI